MCGSAQLLVDTLLQGGIVGSEATLALIPVTVLATDHRISQRININLRRTLAREFLVDALPHGGIVGSEAVFAFVPVSLFATDDSVSQRVDVDIGRGLRGRCLGGGAGHLVVPALGAGHVRLVLGAGERGWAFGGAEVLVTEYVIAPGGAAELVELADRRDQVGSVVQARLRDAPRIAVKSL